MSGDEQGSEIKRTPKCPVCRKPQDNAYRPFCSKRCADVDLGRWATGAYVIPGGDADSDEDGQDNVPETVQNARIDE